MANKLSDWLVEHRAKEAERIAAGKLHWHETLKNCPNCGIQLVVSFDHSSGMPSAAGEECDNCGQWTEWKLTWWPEYILEGVVRIDGKEVDQAQAAGKGEGE